GGCRIWRRTHGRCPPGFRSCCKRASITQYVTSRANVPASRWPGPVPYDTISTMRVSMLALLLALGAHTLAAKNLDIYFVDVEGGQATLFVSPSGQSMMVDTGWPGLNNRDADRIAAVAKLAGVKQI